MDSPLVGVWGKHPRKEFFLEKCLVKYYNFVVNLSRSLCHRPNSRSYVNLGFFHGMKPSFIYEEIVLQLGIILREENVRE